MATGGASGEVKVVKLVEPCEGTSSGQDDNSSSQTDGQSEVFGKEEEGKQRKVCIGVDGSPMAEHALDWYLNNVHQPGNFVILVHSHDVPKFHPYQVSPDVYESSLHREASRTSDMEHVVVKKLKARKIPCKYVSRGGKPATSLVEVAKEEHADMIVIGSKAHGALHRAFMGSISTYIMHHAPCPVIVCKPKVLHTKRKSRSLSESEPGKETRTKSESEAGQNQNKLLRSESDSGEMVLRTRTKSDSESVHVETGRSRSQSDVGVKMPRSGSGSLLKQVLKPKSKQH